MIWFAITAVVTILYVIRSVTNYFDWLETLVTGFMVLAVTGVGSLVLAVFVGIAIYEPVEHSYTFNVMAAKDGTSINGQFGIFGGFIDEEAYYFFYRKYSDGRIEQGKIKASRTSIYQDQETRAFIKVTKTDSELRLWGITPGEDPRYEIHVPDGSVIQDVEFDLE